MFDAHSRQLIDMLPALPALNRDECRKALSAAYLTVLRAKIVTTEANASLEEQEDIRCLLRRMADALESAAVFDRLHGIDRNAQVEEACAFVAAESLTLLANMPLLPKEDEREDEESEEEEADVDQELEEESEEQSSPYIDAMQEAGTSLAIEAGLLYLIGGYDINAVALVKGFPAAPSRRQIESLRDTRLYNAEVLRARLKDFCSGRVGVALAPEPIQLRGGPWRLYNDLIEEVRAWVYYYLAVGITAFLAWLGGEPDSRRGEALALVERVRRATAGKGVSRSFEFGDMYHLASLLAAAFDRASERSVAHVVPLPPTDDASFLAQFQAYLVQRVRGTAESRGRPFLWPSAKEYVQQCLPGPSRDAVVAMPTGSGKSFVAELGIIHALSSGSVIYLAPTNALVHQIRRDLEEALRPFAKVKILAFMGSSEYTGLLEEGFEAFEETQGRFVAVMTPEKCSLALRLTPDIVAECSLCIFDECHLLNDESRGITADVLMAQLFYHAPAMRLILMSAMVANPDQLADWLRTARSHDAKPNITKWRPTRTLRGMLVIDQNESSRPFEDAKAELQQLRAKSKAQSRPRKNKSFDAPLALIAGLSGPWALDADARDFRFAPLDISIEASASVMGHGYIGFNVPSWKNPATRLLAQKLAQNGIPTIAFIMTSRHHPFGLAGDVTSPMPGCCILEGKAMPAIVESWLALADAELGVETELRSLLYQGIAVHTSAMLQVEQAAAEWMFTKGFAKLMFATATLAQGLNLPAIAVVVSGTAMGDPRDADKIPGLGSRADAAILNAFGRAGRPTFSNQGIAVLVPDEAVQVAASNPVPNHATLEATKVLTQPDAGVVIGSPIASFFDRMLATDTLLVEATDAERTLAAQLAEQPLDGDHAGEVLRRTFGGYLRSKQFTPQASLRIRDRLAQIKDQFLQQPGIPSWMNTAAGQSGVHLMRAAQIWDAIQRHGIIDYEQAQRSDVMEWLATFFDILRRLQPDAVSEYLAEDAQKTPTVLTRLRDRARKYLADTQSNWLEDLEWIAHWQELLTLIRDYMSGATYAALSRAYYGPENVPDAVPSKRVMSPKPYNNPLPGVFGFIRDIIDPLSRDAGCLVAILEYAWKDLGTKAGPPPESLQALPLCIRFGCNSLDTLAWFRFGFRNRMSAHAFAQALPLPGGITNDTLRASEVRSLRSRWLSGRLAPIVDSPILTHIATILQEGRE